MKTLIIEDDPMARTMFSTVMAARGYEVTAVVDAESARPLCQSGEFDLIILDVVLPGMDGLHFFAGNYARNPAVGTRL